VLTPPQEDEIILQVPTAVLRTLDTVPKPISRKLPPGVSVHCLLAADLALDTTDRYAAWNAVVPTPTDLETMPLRWPPALQALLPARAAELLAAQRAKHARDAAAAATAFPALFAGDGGDRFLHAWLLVNTRTFYHATPRTERLRPLPEDRLALQPVADLFNHAAAGCAVAFDAEGFAVRADRAYARAEELSIAYGAHPGDFLLVEYGFAAAGRWDAVSLDAVLVPALAARRARRDALEAAGFWGGYALDAEGVCHRTEVALRLLCCPPAEWRRFVDGADAGEASQPRVDGLLRGFLGEYRETARGALARLAGIASGTEAQRDLLRTRWLQILALIEAGIERLAP